MSLRNPLRFFGHPYNAPLWRQLATVDNGLSEVASRRAISYNPRLASDGLLYATLSTYNAVEHANTETKTGTTDGVPLSRSGLTMLVSPIGKQS